MSEIDGNSLAETSNFNKNENTNTQTNLNNKALNAKSIDDSKEWDDGVCEDWEQLNQQVNITFMLLKFSESYSIFMVNIKMTLGVTSLLFFIFIIIYILCHRNYIQQISKYLCVITVLITEFLFCQ